MTKRLAIVLLYFAPCIALCQPKNQPDLNELYQQIDSLQFSLFRLHDSIQRSAIITRFKNDQGKKNLELYRALVRLENNRLTAADSLLLGVSIASIDSGSSRKTITSIEVDGGTLYSLVGSNGSLDSLFADFPKLQQQYLGERLLVNSMVKHMKFTSPTMDLPSIPKMPAATTAQAKKILADRILHWITNACGVCGCQNEVSSMLQEEVKSKMSIDKIIANRRLFIEYVINPLYKNRQ